MRTEIERERKWLLKTLPDQLWDNYKARYRIEQFYDKDGWRYRKVENFYDGSTTYCRLKKKSLGRGINQEVGIEDLTAEQYDKAYTDGYPNLIVRKDRFTFEHEGRKIEVDDFDDVRIAMIEVEDVDINDTVVFPDHLEDNILMEVTGNPKFNNFNLAIREE